MATLTRHNIFKSLKQSSSIKVKKAANSKAQSLAEIETFFMLLNKKKTKANPLKSIGKKLNWRDTASLPNSNKNAVQYLIVGGTAVAFHGYFRWSQNSSDNPTDKFDFDIWYNPTYDNYFKLLNSLTDLGQDVKEFFEEQSSNPLKSYFKFDLDKFTLDFHLSWKE